MENNQNLNFRQLKKEDYKQFSNLIVDMYSNLENLEWFSPMPFDEENVIEMIESPRLYILGAFLNKELVGVSSLDYKCGKLIGKIDFPTTCNTEKLVEIGFNIVSSKHRGKKIMQQLVDNVIKKAKADGYKWLFAKVHKDNIASYKSLQNKGLEYYCEFDKPVKVNEFKSLMSQPFFSKIGKINAEITLKNVSDEQEKFNVNYKIYIRNIY